MFDTHMIRNNLDRFFSVEAYPQDIGSSMSGPVKHTIGTCDEAVTSSVDDFDIENYTVFEARPFWCANTIETHTRPPHDNISPSAPSGCYLYDTDRRT